MRKLGCLWILMASLPLMAAEYEGKYFRGSGDVEYLRLLDKARRMFAPDPEYLNIAMFYEPRWNGFVEGPTWDAWWIQNSYGTTYASLPFLQEPYTTFIRNSNDLWWDQMGDGKRVGAPPNFPWVAPDGALCDAARPGFIIYKQGDGRKDIHDWAFEFTAAGMLMQAEMLLISRDQAAIAHYLPKIERSANFIDSRRDPKNNLFLVGAASNLMAPSYAGCLRPDGTYGPAYLAGLSITYIAALDRLIELEKIAGAADKVKLFTERRELVRKGLAAVTTEEGYFIKSLDPDGTKHGVYGAAQHGYFEAAPNHDAIAFRVVDDVQANRIYNKIASIPQLRPYDLIITNYPALDDMYHSQTGIWEFGHWVNGGHWSTCEARMMMAYARLGKYEDSRKSMQRILGFAERFRMDNNLTNFGSDLYQPKLPINVVYDAFAIPAALVRGLFEYQYRADGLTVLPHIPPGITALEQRFPVRFGSRNLYLATYGTGAVTGVMVNGRAWKTFDKQSVTFAPDSVPDGARIQILLGGVKAPKLVPEKKVEAAPVPEGLDARVVKVAEFHKRLTAAGLGSGYAAAHAQLAVDMAKTARERSALLVEGKLKRLPEPSAEAAEKIYADTATKLLNGLDEVIAKYKDSSDPTQKKIYDLYTR